MPKATPEELLAVTARVVDKFTSSAMLFTALDVSNAVKASLPDIRHREVSPIVRDTFARGSMGLYRQTLIDVVAGREKVQAYLYHLPKHPAGMYDDAMRSQLAIPPVAVGAEDADVSVTDTTTELLVPIGQDGRGRVSRHLLKNAGIGGAGVLVKVTAVPPKLQIYASGAAITGQTEALTFEHPELLHLPQNLVGIFAPGAELLARIEGTCVTIKDLN
jgi:hypothetical protein